MSDSDRNLSTYVESKGYQTLRGVGQPVGCSNLCYLYPDSHDCVCKTNRPTIIAAVLGFLVPTWYRANVSRRKEASMRQKRDRKKEEIIPSALHMGFEKKDKTLPFERG